MHRVPLLMIGLFLTGLTVLSAQSVSSGPHFSMDPVSPPPGDVNESLDMAVFSDAESQTYFIDFESLDVNVNYVLVKGSDGNVLWKDRVFDLPVDTIYEIDCSGYQPGQYTVELQTFTSVLRTDIQIRP